MGEPSDINGNYHHGEDDAEEHRDQCQGDPPLFLAMVPLHFDLPPSNDPVPGRWLKELNDLRRGTILYGRTASVHGPAN